VAKWLVIKEDCYLLSIYLQPRASRDEVVALFDGRLNVRIKAPPVGGKANKALFCYLAKLFGVAKRDVTLLVGEADRRKKICIKNASKIPAELAALIAG
jgi:uncharacterized protein (TIGR00251 family)